MLRRLLHRHSKPRRDAKVSSHELSERQDADSKIKANHKTTSEQTYGPEKVSTAKPPYESAPDPISEAAASSTAAITPGHKQTEATATDNSNALLVNDQSVNESLWDQAYTALAAENKRLVDDYEKILSRELPTAEPAPKAKENSSSVDEDSLDETGNSIEKNTQDRQMQLQTIIKSGLQRVEEKKIAYTIAGHEMVLEEQIAQAANLVQWAKGLIDEAVKASPEASLIWAGVSLILPLLTQPSAAEAARRDGFTHVTARMRFYVALEPLILPRDAGSNSHKTLSEESKKEFEARIVDLYQHILEFQLQSVLHFYRSRRRNFGRAIIGKDQWKQMLEQIQKLETIIHLDFKKINDSRVRQELESISKSANQSLECLQDLVAVAGKQLETQNEILQVNKQGFQGLRDLLFDVLDAVGLPVIDNARYRSAEVQDEDKCHEHTRVSILKEIMEWTDCITSESIFWLSGPAGTGKSTIARTVAASLLSRSRLAAGYFFNSNTNEPGRNDTERFFTTIASQLISSIPGFNDHLRKSLGRLKSVNIEKSAIEEQFETLIEIPLSRAAADGAGPQNRMSGVIIVDALDECVRRNHIPRIINLLLRLRNIRNIQLRVLVTSRSSHTILHTFKSLDKSANAYRRLALENDFIDETKADISTFLRSRFETIKMDSGVLDDPWPREEDLNRLVDLATTPSPLFVYAATVCRFVYNGENELDDPLERLSRWLEQCDRNASQLRQIYEPILNEYFSSGQRRDVDMERDISSERQQGMRILAALVLVATPVSAAVLSSLLAIRRDIVTRYLRKLHAVLTLPDGQDAPITLLHKSFSDFLLDDTERAHDFYQVDSAETHRILATRCIEIMEATLRRDIGNIQDPSKPLEDVRDVVTRSIPSELWYASLYWIHHSVEGEQHNVDEDRILTFLENHFLHWVETEIRGSCWNTRLPLIQDAMGTRAQWDPCLSTLDIKVVPGVGLVFSPNSQIIACPLFDEITLWDVATGAHQRTLQVDFGDADCLNAISFSPDGEWVVQGTDNGRVVIFDVTTGSIERKFELEDSVLRVIFSPDGKKLAAVTSRQIMLWNMEVTASVVSLMVPSPLFIKEIAFSGDSKILASVVGEGLIQLWDAETGARLQPLQIPDISVKFPGYESGIRAIKFLSGDRRLAAVLSAENTIVTWDLTKDAGPQRQSMNSKLLTQVHSVVFSPDGELIAFEGLDVLVFCDTATGAERHVFPSGPEYGYDLTISPDSKIFATASSVVWLWDLTADSGMFASKAREITAVGISADGTVIAMSFTDRIVEVWEPATRALRQQFEFTEWASLISLSDNHQMIAVVIKYNKLEVCDIRTRDLLFVVEFDDASPKSVVRHASFSHDGQQIAASNHNTVWVWNVATAALNFSVDIPQSSIRDLTFSSDDGTIGIAYYHVYERSHGVKTWDVTTGAHVSTVNYSSLSNYYFLREPHNEPTDRSGPISLSPHSPDTWDELAIMISDNWVVRGGQKLLWLPAGNRPTHWGSAHLVANSPDALVIGHTRGQRTFIKFSFL
ncbi:hypothetical protein IFM61392_01594 [Aspergillus lentulus]|nr:hypothetical protein IFM61392_01594 [Aspergillus lentulus]